MISVGIKALNEEKHIERAIRSALEAVRPFDGEVILADSGSLDRTIDIARRYPVRIFQLANPSERSCGAGAQLAFQHVTNPYFYMLDADMALHPDFLPAGMAFLDANPTHAGVGGAIREMETSAHEFAIRAQRAPLAAAQDVDRLDCGGLYRTVAIASTGYFADRNLKAFEEFELATRLSAKGWRLARIPQPAVDHYGHAMSGYSLMLKRLRNGHLSASGQVLRGALGRAHLPAVLRRLSHLRVFGLVALWWLLILMALSSRMLLLDKFVVLASLLGAPLALLSWRRRSVGLGLFSLANWNAATIGFIAGLFAPRVPPEQPLTSITLQPQTSATAA